MSIEFMKRVTFNSIRQEILFYGAIALIIVSATIIGYASISQYTISVEGAYANVASISIEQNTILKEEIDKALDIGRTLAGSMTGSLSTGKKSSREDIQAMVYGIMMNNPKYNGIYIVLEPEVWDGQDSNYKGKPGTDDSGRFMAYYSRDSSGKPILDHVYGYNAGEEGSEYYQVPKTTLKEYITEPYPWDIQGRKILLSSVVVPIVVEGKFMGIAGVDLPLENVQDLADKITAYNKESAIYFISHSGIVAGSTGYPRSVGKNLGDAAVPLSKGADNVVRDIQSGRNNVQESDGKIIAFSPLSIGNSEKPWSVIFTVPVDIATAHARTNTIVLIFLGVIFTIFGLAILVIAARGITRPIEQITVYANSIAQGELGEEITIERTDEIGILAHSFRRLLTSLQGKALAADGIAAGDLSVFIPVSSERDILGASMVTMRDTIRNMTKTVTELSGKATLGDLHVRGEEVRYQGEYRKIIIGINETLDAVINPINGAMKLADAYASGDYTARFDTSIPVEGAFRTFRNSLNFIGEQGSSSVRGVKDQLKTVSANIEETTTSLEEVSASSEVLAGSSTEVSSLTHTSLYEVSQILKAMNDLSMNISHVAEMTDTVASISHVTNDLSSKGSHLARHAEGEMKKVIHSIEESGRTMVEMSQQMSQIGQIVELISDISDQTNLLALNAAIEAARAGDAGRGFAVVADEVKTLAIESQKSAEKIGSLIRTLQLQSSNASEAMNQSSKDVIQGNNAVNETLLLFSQIVEQIKQISEHTSSVASAAEEQAAAVQEITASVHELEYHVTRTAEEAVSSAAATQETSAALSQITQALSSVSQASEQINQEMRRFTV